MAAGHLASFAFLWVAVFDIGERCRKRYFVVLVAQLHTCRSRRYCKIVVAADPADNCLDIAYHSGSYFH